jgi:hypothetical protein
LSVGCGLSGGSGASRRERAWHRCVQSEPAIAAVGVAYTRRRSGKTHGLKGRMSPS